MVEVAGFDVAQSLEDMLRDYRRYQKRIKKLNAEQKKFKGEIVDRIKALPQDQRRIEVKNEFTQSEYVTIAAFAVEIRHLQRRTGYVVAGVRKLIRLKQIAAETIRGLFSTVIDLKFLDELIKKGVFTQEELKPHELPRKSVEQLRVKLEGEEDDDEDLEEDWSKED